MMNRKTKTAIVALVLLVFTTTTTNALTNPVQLTMCRSTDYKDTCMKSLLAAGKTTDQKLLLKTAFFAAINGTRKALAAMVNPNDYEVCREVLEFSIDNIEKAINKLDKLIIYSNKDKIVELQSDIKTHLSGSLTFHQTCMDEIEKVTTSGDNHVARDLKLSRELSSNALAMLCRNRTFEANPSWISEEKKRLLMAPSPPASVGDKENNSRLLIVSKDGSGMYKTINEALRQIGNDSRSVKKFVIHVKAGVYEEYVVITKKMKNVFLIGDGATKTRITGNRSLKSGFKTFWTATVIVKGENFVAKDIAFENTAGADGDQAVALRITADKVVIYRSYIDGYQDTLYAHAHRQFYRDCTISGTIDFIFGDAAAVFQNCNIVVKRPGADQKICTVTAQSRSDMRSSTGFVLQNCTITNDATYYAQKHKLRSFLGRPWNKYSRTMIMESYIEDFIDPMGWLPWAGKHDYLRTLWYGEYLNRGPGSDLTKRVSWPGFHKNITNGVASDFVPGRFIFADQWVPKMDVPYFSGFTTPNRREMIGARKIITKTTRTCAGLP